MSDETQAKPISMAAVTALALGAVGAACAWFLIPGLKFVSLGLAIAAIIVGAASAVNTRRRDQSGAGLAWAGVALGALTLVGLLVWQLAV